jgi:ubiquinone/menaquinone biosynthesis C-methylase UbiE
MKKALISGWIMMEQQTIKETTEMHDGYGAPPASIDEEGNDSNCTCGTPIPPSVEGCTILDMGCGTGRDTYRAARLTGPNGFVIGIDTGEKLLEEARRNVVPQMSRFGHPKANVDFRQGRFEDLAACGISDNSVDVIISTSAINLSTDKERVFSEIFRVLRTGGELYFSNIFASRRIPNDLATDPLLVGKCLGGALYQEDFRRMLNRLGCADYRVVSRQAVRFDDHTIARRSGMIDFTSMTVRAFKLATLEDICEDYGQTATYLGTIPGMPHAFSLDDHHCFETGKPMLVCGNTASMASETRFAPHFHVSGDRSRHFGPFPCGPSPTSNNCCCS